MSYVGMSHPFQMFNGNFSELGKMSNLVMKSISVTRSIVLKCNACRMVNVTAYSHFQNVI